VTPTQNGSVETKPTCFKSNYDTVNLIIYESDYDEQMRAMTKKG